MPLALTSATARPVVTSQTKVCPSLPALMSRRWSQGHQSTDRMPFVCPTNSHRGCVVLLRKSHSCSERRFAEHRSERVQRMRHGSAARITCSKMCWLATRSAQLSFPAMAWIVVDCGVVVVVARTRSTGRRSSSLAVTRYSPSSGFHATSDTEARCGSRSVHQGLLSLRSHTMTEPVPTAVARM